MKKKTALSVERELTAALEKRISVLTGELRSMEGKAVAYKTAYETALERLESISLTLARRSLR